MKDATMKNNIKIKATEIPNLGIVWIVFILLTSQVVFGQNVANYTSTNGDTWALQAQSDGNFSIVGTNSGMSQITQFEFSYNGKLQLHRQANRTSGHTGELIIGGARNAVGNSFGNIGFYNYDEHGSSTDFLAAKISAFKADNDAGGLEFQVSKDKTIMTAMTIDQDLKTTMAGGLTVNGNDGLSAKKVTLEHGIVFGHLSGSQVVWDFGFDQYGNLGLSAVDMSAPYGTEALSITFGQRGSIFASSYFVGNSGWGIAHNTDHELEFYHEDFLDKSITLSQKGIVEAIGFSGDGSQLENIQITGGRPHELKDPLEFQLRDDTNVKIRGNSHAGLTLADYAGHELDLTYDYIENEDQQWIGFTDGANMGEWLFRSSSDRTILAEPSDAKVGIGTLNPSEKLDVDGTVKAHAFIGDGSELTGIKIEDLIISSAPNVENLFIGHNAGGVLAINANNVPYVGSGNVVIGSRAGASIVEPTNSTITENNVLIGVEAAESLKHGEKNVFIGTSAGADIKEGSSNIIIGMTGNHFGDHVDNTLAIGFGHENLIYGEFDNKILRVNGELTATSFIGDGSQLTGIDVGSLDFSGEIEFDELVLRTSDNNDSYHGLRFQNSGEASVWNIFRTPSTSSNAYDASLVFAGGPNKDEEEDLPHVMSLREDGLVFIGSDPTGIVSIDGIQRPSDLALPNGDYKLAVRGKAIAEEVTVLNASQWADFVFEEGYQLEPLESVEAYIQENGHLEHIPTSAEVTEKGINLGEMDARLLRKIEELTLHMIDMNERVKGLEQENAELRKILAK